jgi:hypothetical protein
MRESLLRLQTDLIYAAMVGTMRLPDPLLAGVMGRLHDIARLTTQTDEEELIQRLAELEEFFNAGPPCSDALRAMVLEARPSQMKSIIRGYLVNYIYDL